MKHRPICIYFIRANIKANNEININKNGLLNRNNMLQIMVRVTHSASKMHYMNEANEANTMTILQYNRKRNRRKYCKKKTVASPSREGDPHPNVSDPETPDALHKMAFRCHYCIIYAYSPCFSVPHLLILKKRSNELIYELPADNAEQMLFSSSGIWGILTLFRRLL